MILISTIKKTKMKTYFTEWTDQIMPWLLDHGIKILFITIGAFILNKIVQRFIIKAVRMAVLPDKTAINEDAEKKREDTLIQIFSTTTKVTLIGLVILMVLQEFGVLIAPILAAAGVVGLAFGFGGQYLIRDLIAGLFIILENQYRIGDVVIFDNIRGVVEAISLRKTTLRDLDGAVHHVPHGEIKIVSNLTKDFSRINMNIGVSYNAASEHVISVINSTGQELANDILWKPFIIKAPQFLRIDDFADSSVVFKIIGETVPLKQWEVAGEFRKRIKKAFDKEGIEIPFPQMVLHQKSDKADK